MSPPLPPPPSQQQRERERERVLLLLKTWRRFYFLTLVFVLNYCNCFPIFIWYRRCLFVVFVLVVSVFVRCISNKKMIFRALRLFVTGLFLVVWCSAEEQGIELRSGETSITI